MECKRVVLTRGFHQALSDFLWLEWYLIKRPKRMYELVPLHPMPDVYHNASGYMCEGEVLPEPTAVP